MILDIYRNSVVIKSVTLDEKTVINRRLMTEDTLAVSLDTTRPLPLAVGDYVVIDGCRYELSDNPDYTLTDGVYSYNAVFYGSLHSLERYLMPDEGKDDFYYFGTMAEHVAFILSEISKKEAGWSIALPSEITPDMTKPLNINYAGCTMLGAVRKVCDKDVGYNLEFDIENKRIAFAAEIRRPTSVSFSYGRGKGLYKISRGKLSGESIVTRLYGYGGTTNMMLGSRLSFEGGYIEKNVDKYGLREGKVTFDNIYPRRNSTLTSGAVQVSAGSAAWNVADTAIDFDLNAQTLENAQIMFTGGDCAGLSFVISKYNHATKTVTFKEIAYENQSPVYVVPNPDRKPKTGDGYVFTGIIMPDSYVTAAKAELAAATAAEVAKRSVPQHPYTVECDPRFFKGKDYRPRPGDLCRLKDAGNALDAEIRISGVEFPLIDPFACKLTISDKVPIPTSVILDKKVDNVVDRVEIVDLAQQQNARRQAGALNELSNYLLDSEGYFDAAKFKALSIEARMLAIGLTAQNFTLSGVTVTPNYGNVSTVNITSGKLTHNIINTDGFNGIWNVAGATLSAASTSKAYYLYAKCSKNTPSATLHLAEAEPAVDAEDNYYLFNIGVLYPQRPGDDYRDFQSTKGVTNIVGDQIYTGVIRALDNFNFIDLRPTASSGRFRLGRSNCSMDFGVTAPDTLSMRGVKIINQGGDAALLPVWRGDWSNLLMYYTADEVFWNGSTYRCLQNTPTAGIMPINTTYWKQAAAKGDKGGTGDTGADAVSYWVVPSVDKIQKSATGVLTPASVTCAKMKQVGAGTPITATDRQLYYHLSTGVETAYIGAVSIGAAQWIEFILKDGATVLDRERVPVVADGANGESGEVITGRMIFRDPEFRQGMNNCGLYNNLNNGAVTIDRIARPFDCPTTSDYCLRIITNGAATPYLGGYRQETYTRPNAVFVFRIIAKIPSGYKMDYASNAYGDGGKCEAVTSMAGTGRYETYSWKVICGSTGSFDSGGYFYLYGGTAPVTWHVASSTCYDMTDSEKYDQEIFEQKTRLDNWASDAVISPTEKNSLKDQHSAAVKEKVQIDSDVARYGLTANVKYTAYVSAASLAFAAWNKYTAAVPENIPVSSDYANIAAFYEKRAAIQTLIAEAAAGKAVDSVQVGVSNLMQNSNFAFGNPFNRGEVRSELEGRPLYGNSLFYWITSVAQGDTYTNVVYANGYLKPNTEYTFTLWWKSAGIGLTSSTYYFIYNPSTGTYYQFDPIGLPPAYGGYRKTTINFTTPNIEGLRFGYRLGFTCTAAAWICVNCVSLTEGNKAPAGWEKSQADIDAEITAIANRQLEAEAITKNFTSIDGGLLLTTLIKLLDNNVERGGFNGLAKGADPAIWFGGSYADALLAAEAVRIILRANGSSRLGELDISATGKLGLGGDKVILTKDNIDPLSSMLGSAVSGSVNNAAASSSVTEEKMLPNALTVTRDNSTLTVSTSISASADVSVGQEDTSGASFTTALYLQYPDTSRVLLGSVTARAGGRDIHGNPISSDTKTFAVNHLEVAKAGTYRLILKTTKGFIMGMGSASGGVAASTISFRYDLSQGRFMVGRNGLALVKDANKYLYCSTDDTNAFFQVKGKTDMPGVLRAGAVNEVGAIAGNWGAKDCTCIRPNGETGRYRITHSIGHTNYYVTATPYSNNTTTIENKTTSYVDVVIHQNTGGKINCGFDFMICGSN